MRAEYRKTGIKAMDLLQKASPCLAFP